MAKEFYGYFDSTEDDAREYDASQFANILRAVALNGVTSHDGGLEVAADGLSMQTVVAPGGCIINGYVYVLEDDGGEQMSFTHPASSTADRIDRIVVRLKAGMDERAMELALLTGTPGAAPSPPELTRNDAVYELALAQVRVRAGVTVVTPEDVTDERPDETVCGYAVPAALRIQRLDARYGTEAITDVEIDGILEG